MSGFEQGNFINISFMICFSLDLDQNIGLKFLYLPKIEKNLMLNLLGKLCHFLVLLETLQ
jgi:hypothetical protein